MDPGKQGFNQNQEFNNAGQGAHPGGHSGIPRILTAAGAAVPTTFLGRTQELQEIRDRLTSQSTIALVNGEGGMGKTTLAAYYWQQYEQEYKHLAWLFCEKGILIAMRNQLPGPLGLIEVMNQYADNGEQQAIAIKTAMANLPKDCLIVLDNANEPEHILGFLQYMTGLGWHVLMTTRCTNVLPDASSEYAVNHLPPHLAKALFTNNYREDNPEFDALLDRFLTAVGHNTLCIEIFSKNLREGKGWGLTLAKLLAQLEQKGLLLGEDSFVVATDYIHHVQQYEAQTSDQIIEALYHLSDLPKDESDLLLQFALLPAESHAPEVLTALLAPDDQAGLRKRLDRLAQKGWISRVEKGYRISPVVQKIVLYDRGELLWSLGEPLVERLEVIFENEGFHSKNIGVAAPFAALVFTLSQHLNVGHDELGVLFHRLWVFYTAIGNLALALETATRALAIAQKGDDKYGLSLAYSKLGETHSALGNLNQALTFYEDYSRLKMELYQNSPQNVAFKNGLAIAYSKLGETHSKLGDLNQALTYYEDYSRLIKELHKDSPQNEEFKNNLAIAYSKLGETHSNLGNLNQALTFFEDYSRLKKELYQDFPQNADFKNGLAISYEKLGSTHSALGNLNQALTFFEDYSRLKKELYQDFSQNVNFKNGLAIAYSKLGSTHSTLGNFNQALTFFEDCSRLKKELYQDFPQNVKFKNGLAVSYAKLGTFYRDQGKDHIKAKPYFEQCFTLWKELSETYPDYVEFSKNFKWAQHDLNGLNEVD